MMKDDALTSHVDLVKTETTGTQQIPIFHVFNLDDIKSKDILSNENLLQVYSTDEGKSESVIIGESFMKESESENLHKSINTKPTSKSL